MKKILLLTALLVSMNACVSQPKLKVYPPTPEILPGATDLEAYLPLLEGKRVAILSNQTGMVSEDRHVLDTLLALNVKLEAGTAGFEPDCPYNVLREQQRLMGEYLHVLRLRAEYEGIEL